MEYKGKEYRLVKGKLGCNACAFNNIDDCYNVSSCIPIGETYITAVGSYYKEVKPNAKKK